MAVEVGDTDETWSDDLVGLLDAPPTAQSARVSFVIDAGLASAFEANLDSVFFQAAVVVFEDGFETGDTSRWQ